MFWQHYNELDSYRKLDIKIKIQGLFSTTKLGIWQLDTQMFSRKLRYSEIFSEFR